jgi:hypothetical protein
MIILAQKLNSIIIKFTFAFLVGFEKIEEAWLLTKNFYFVLQFVSQDKLGIIEYNHSHQSAETPTTSAFDNKYLFGMEVT